MRYAIAIAALLSACSPDPGASIANLESVRRETEGNLIRQQAECVAQARELPGQPAMSAACWEAYRVMQQAAETTYADIDRRIAELRR